MTDSARIFFVLGALQSLAVEQLAGTGGYDHELLINASGYPMDLPDGVETLSITGSGPGALPGYRRALAAATRLRRQYARTDVAVPHPFHAIGNYLAFGLGADAVDLLPDGILNYYPRRLSTENQRAMRGKSLLLRSLGYRYRRYEGALDGCDSLNYRRAYTFYAERMTSRAAGIEQLELPQAENAGTGGVLFVDQPVTPQHRDSLPDVREGIADLLRGGEALFLKPHPSGARPSYFPPGFSATVLENSVPVERIAPTLPLDTIVGVSSSSLLTLKLSSPRVRCVSVGLRRLVARQPDLAGVRTVLEQVGVEIQD